LAKIDPVLRWRLRDIVVSFQVLGWLGPRSPLWVHRDLGPTRPRSLTDCGLAAWGWGSAPAGKSLNCAVGRAFLARLLETELADRRADALVFPSARGGGWLTLGQARYAFQKATAVVEGCDGVRLRDLRHTCASLAIRSGANVKVVQKLLGHKTAVLTLDRYGHLFPDGLDAVPIAFDSAADALRTVPVLKVVASTENSR
jgi:hypothetical protein